jgi:hypothetical protein
MQLPVLLVNTLHHGDVFCCLSSGRSLIPAEHRSIGIISNLIAAIEPAPPTPPTASYLRFPYHAGKEIPRSLPNSEGCSYIEFVSPRARYDESKGGHFIPLRYYHSTSSNSPGVILQDWEVSEGLAECRYHLARGLECSGTWSPPLKVVTCDFRKSKKKTESLGRITPLMWTSQASSQLILSNHPRYSC